MNGHISLNRKIIDWEWYQDAKTKAVFIHCLLNAYWKDGRYQGKNVPRGSFITTVTRMAGELGMSKKEIRTALSKLEKTGEIEKITQGKRYHHIFIKNYDLYQNGGNSEDTGRADQGHEEGKPRADQGQTKGTNEIQKIDTNEAIGANQKSAVKPVNSSFVSIEEEKRGKPKAIQRQSKGNPKADQGHEEGKPRADQGQTKGKHNEERNNINNINNNIYTCASADDAFEQLWELYPRKRGKKQVKDKQKRRLAEIGIPRMTKAIERFKEDMRGTEEQFIPYGSTFFNSLYFDYLDDPDEDAPPVSPDTEEETPEERELTAEEIEEECAAWNDPHVWDDDFSLDEWNRQQAKERGEEGEV